MSNHTNSEAPDLNGSTTHSGHPFINGKPIDIASDAKRVFEVLKNGGLAIVPADIGYGLIAIDPAALQKAFVTKQRQAHKRHAMVGSWRLHKELHVLPEREAKMVEVLAKDLDLPIGVIAPYRADHPIIQQLGENTLKRSSVDGTIAMLVNGGALQDEISRLCMDANLPLMGSSANLTGRGTKSLVENIEPEILAVADIIIDYGKRKFSQPRPSSTLIDFRTLELMRYGACFDVIQDVFKRWYGIVLPDDPGMAVNFSGHRREAAKM
jgi:tRNA A37 threonylcarbamoyladenosine synthetase subunit TsaC/SUA5/YrdC